MATTHIENNDHSLFINHTLNYLKECETKAYNKGFEAGREIGQEEYLEALDKGIEVGLRKVASAAEWFHETYGTEYVVYGADSIIHLMDLFNKEFGL